MVRNTVAILTSRWKDYLLEKLVTCDIMGIREKTKHGNDYGEDSISDNERNALAWSPLLWQWSKNAYMMRRRRGSPLLLFNLSKDSCCEERKMWMVYISLSWIRSLKAWKGLSLISANKWELVPVLILSTKAAGINRISGPRSPPYRMKNEHIQHQPDILPCDSYRRHKHNVGVGVSNSA